MAGEDGSIDKHIAFDSLHAGFFQRGNHITNILTFKRRIAAKACNKVTFQHAVVKGAFGFQRRGETEVRA